MLTGLGLDVAPNLADFSGLDSAGIRRLRQDLPQLTILADVTNPYAGPNGFAAVFGPQKGGIAPILAAQDSIAWAIVNAAKQDLKLDLQAIAGTGAAGGLAGALVLLGGKIQPGFDKIADLIGLNQALAMADLVITGEGKMDAQTAQGKLINRLAQLAGRYHIPTIALCGSLPDLVDTTENLTQMEQQLLANFSIQRGPLPLNQAMEKSRTLANVEKLAQNVAKLLSVSSDSR